jgi:hypothetical protein
MYAVVSENANRRAKLLQEEMYTHQYYKHRSIIKPNQLEQYLVHGVLASGLLFTCLSLAVLIK